MFVEPLLFSLILAKLRGGKFSNIEKMKFNSLYLILMAGAIQLLLAFLKKINPQWASFIIEDYFIYIHGLTYLLIVICIFLNIKMHSMKFFLIGVLLNFLVITSNAGKMPVSITGFKGINSQTIELPKREFDIKHMAVTKDTKLVYLGDIILIPRPYPLPKILSVGDLFIILGLFLFIQEIMILDKNDKYPNSTN